MAEQTEPHHHHNTNVPSPRGGMSAPKALDKVVHRGVLHLQCSHAAGFCV